jgi:gas vesicle protein
VSTDNPNTPTYQQYEPHATTSTDPDAIRADIEQTRANLSRDVNALGEAVTPGHVARRQADKVKDAAVGVKDRIMGSAHDAGDSASHLVHGVGDRASGMAHGVSDTATDAKYTARRKTQGNPMAAGLIALGAGWLLGSLMPASQKERELAQTAKDKAQPVLDEAQSVAKDAAAHLKEPAQEAATAVKDSAQGAVENVKAEGQSTAADVRSSAQDSAQTVREQTTH